MILNKYFKTFLWASIMVLIGEKSIAQSQYRIENFESKDGLTFSDVHSLLQDKNGFIWFASNTVLTRFDGYEFKTYRYDPNDSLRSALHFRITGLSMDPKGNLIIMGSGRLRYNAETDSFTPEPLKIKVANLQTIIEDHDGKTTWVGTYLEGLFAIDNETGKTEKYFNKIEGVDGLRNDINGLADLGSSILLATLKGLWLFDKETKVFSRPPCNPNDSALLYQSPFRNITPDSKGNFWTNRIGGIATLSQKGYPDFTTTGDGSSFLKIDSNFNILHQFILPKGIDGMIHAIDTSGVHWGSVEEGLFRYDPANRSFIIIKNDPSNPHSLMNNSVKHVLIDHDQNVWVATNNGLSVFKKRSLVFHRTNSREGIIDGSTIYQDGNKEYLILGRRRLKILLDQNPNDILLAPLDSNKLVLDFHNILSPIPAYSISYFLQGRHYFWVSAPGAGVFGYPIDHKSGIIKDGPVRKIVNDPENKNTIGLRLVTALLEDEAGNLWIGNKRTGLDFVSGTIPYGTEGSVLNYRHHDNEPTSILSGGIYGLYREAIKSFWVLTETGIDKFHIDEGSYSNGHFEHIFKDKEEPFTFFRSKDKSLFLGTSRGLYEARESEKSKNMEFIPLWTNSSVVGIQEDKLGRLWAITGHGLICFSRTGGATVEFLKVDGVEPSNSIDLTKSGLMIMVDPDGVTIFDPLSLIPNKREITPVLTHLEINNKPIFGNSLNKIDGQTESDITSLELLTLDHLHNNFSFKFSAMEMTDPEKNLYRHMMEGYDPDWIETSYKNRSATYTNLPAGTYTFRVKASNHHGVWSDNERTLKVIILPPPWRTWWAYTGYGFMLVGLLYWARSNIVQRERLKSNLKLEQLEHEKEHFELEKAKEVDKIKTSFFTNISHEFRTPLTLIKGPVQNIIDQFISHQQVIDRNKIVEQLRLVQQNSDLLLKLINQLLDLAKLESGTMTIEKSKGDIVSFINAISSSFHSLASQKNVTFSLELPLVQYEALFDKDKLETILINLINNAIKFTPSGGSVTVIADVGAKQGKPTRNPDILKLSVKDTGIGIPEDHQNKIFERFHQVSEHHKEVGTGIGLALVKELVTLMGGTITVKSKPGEGSEFMISLPIEEVKELTEANSTVSLRQSKTDTTESFALSGFENLHLTNDKTPITDNHKTSTENSNNKPHILVVEDNHDLRSFIIDCLGNEFNFLEGENGKQGLETALAEIPDLIISDIMMPGMDGITMVGKIKSDIRTSHIPLILLTAKSTEDSKLHGLQQGADDYLTKPFNKHELLLKVRNAIQRQLKLRERLRAELMSIAPKVEVLSADEKFLNEVKENILKRLNDEQLSVESLAENMNMSRVHLYRKVSALTGLSVNELIRKLRLQKAAQLLQQKWGPVSQVAYEVGFSNLSYFSKVFKEEFAILPSEYMDSV